MAEKKILGITEDELERVEEDLDVEDLDDFELDERPRFYEVWALGYTADYEATEFELLVDDNYTDLQEARKCFEYMLNSNNFKQLLETKNINIPDDTKHIHLFLEECLEVDDGSGDVVTECQDVIDEAEVY